jgi:putative tricarboxylic transport membrane protein
MHCDVYLTVGGVAMKLLLLPRALCPLSLAALFACAPLSAVAQAWKPERAVEIVLSTSPGSGPDNMARAMQRMFQAHRYLDVPLTVQNKAGGNGAVARNYLKQFAGNGHYLYSMSKSTLAGHAMGRYDYTDLAPVAILYGEYIGIAVKADSPIKSGRDLIERLKKDPAAHSVGLGAGGLGDPNYQGLASALKGAGVDIRKIRNVSFNSGAQAIIALLGGHVDTVPVSVGLWEPHIKTGAVRVIAVSSPERLSEAFSGIPTWREQGVNTVVFNWRAMSSAKGITAAQVAYWENIFQRLTETPEWKAEMVLRGGVTQFTGAAAMKKRMDDEYPEVKALLVDLDLAKK